MPNGDMRFRSIDHEGNMVYSDKVGMKRFWAMYEERKLKPWTIQALVNIFEDDHHQRKKFKEIFERLGRLEKVDLCPKCKSPNLEVQELKELADGMKCMDCGLKMGY